MNELDSRQQRQVVELVERLAGMEPSQQDAELAAARDPRVVLEVQKILRAAHGLEDGEIKPGTRLGEFELIRKIGHGGCGVVYQALQDPDHLRRVVALKIIRPEMKFDDAYERLFLDEMNTLARLNHEGIVRIHSRGMARDVSGGRRDLHYFAMEWIEGGSIVAACRGLEAKEKVRRFLPVCEALESAHREDVMHLDLKPANILFSSARGQAVVLDFGFARRASGPLPVQNLGCTPHYASPEQLRHQIAGFRSDVYSLGMVLFQMLTDTLPYRFPAGATPMPQHYVAAALAPERMKLREFGRQFDAALERTLDQALRRDSAERTESVGQLGRQLRQWLEKADHVPPRRPSSRAADSVRQMITSENGDAIGGDKHVYVLSGKLPPFAHRRAKRR